MGRELDALVAEKVMGISPEGTWKEMSPSIKVLIDIPDYSTSIADAWMVVGKMGLSAVYDKEEDVWFAGKMEWQETEGWQFNIQETAPTAPEAICLAALKAVGHE